MNAASTTAEAMIDSNAARRYYHYSVSATDSDGVIHVDSGCPTIEVV